MHPTYGNHVKYLVWQPSPTMFTGIAQRRIFENGTYYYEIQRDNDNTLDIAVYNDIIARIEKED